MSSLTIRGATSHQQTRRAFLAQTVTGALSVALGPPDIRDVNATPSFQPSLFRTDYAKLQARYDDAIRGLRKNLVRVFRFPQQVLIEGGGYPGIWLECGPQEGLVYGAIAPTVARANHEVFFDLQRDDGYLPCWVHFRQLGTGQIQMVVPIAATAHELFEQMRDEEFLAKAYASCSRWDDWLVRYRNTRGTGLCEAFCGYDTGHDNSPRFKDLPWKCPNNDARICPQAPGLPFLAPDLSATVYGGRIALAKMARALGKTAEAQQWQERAEAIQKAILAHCFDPTTQCFYDVDANGQFVRIKGDALTRVLGEHVVGQQLFDQIYERHLHNPKEFWTPFPLPSIAVNDPAFDHSLPENSWGGATQALTALRAPRWMEHYGKPADLADLMERWVKALVASQGFRQQMNPWTGAFSTGDEYSPAMLVLFDFVSRLHGIRAGGNTLEWNCRIPEGAKSAEYRLPAPRGLARMKINPNGAELSIGNRLISRIQGKVRLTTGLDGQALSLTGTCTQVSEAHVMVANGQRLQVYVKPNAVVEIPQ